MTPLVFVSACLSPPMSVHPTAQALAEPPERGFAPLASGSGCVRCLGAAVSIFEGGGGGGGG